MDPVFISQGLEPVLCGFIELGTKLPYHWLKLGKFEPIDGNCCEIRQFVFISNRVYAYNKEHFIFETILKE